jgi:hypothetical protein
MPSWSVRFETAPLRTVDAPSSGHDPFTKRAHQNKSGVIRDPFADNVIAAWARSRRLQHCHQAGVLCA